MQFQNIFSLTFSGAFNVDINDTYFWMIQSCVSRKAVAQVFSIMFVVIKRIYLNLIQTMTLLTFLSRLYCFSFKDPSFWGVFWWVFFQKYILRIQNNIVHFYGKQESSKDNNESFGPCSNPLLI